MDSGYGGASTTTSSRPWRFGRTPAEEAYRQELLDEALDHASRSSNPLLQSALAYAQRGWPVFRVAPRGKVPLYKGITKASTDPFVVVSWWRASPDANIGIATGKPSRLVIVDLDGKCGFRNWEQLLDEHRQIETLRAASGRADGGEHLYFTYPPGFEGWLKSAANVLADGIDIRADGGYIIAPPSVHPSGATYRWVEPDAPIAVLPAWIEAILRTERRTVGLSDGEAKVEISINDWEADLAEYTEGHPYGRRALEEESRRLADTRIGMRDRVAVDVYLRMGRLVGSRLLDGRKAVRSLLWSMETNGMGRASHEDKLRLFEDGLRQGVANPVRPGLEARKAPVWHSHEDPSTDLSALSEFLSFTAEGNQKNSDNETFVERLPLPLPHRSAAGGPDHAAFGTLTEVLTLDEVLALTEDDLRCHFRASIVLADSKDNLFVGPTRCHRRSCVGCHLTHLRAHLDQLTSITADQDGCWWLARVETEQWSTLYKALDRAHLGYSRLPVTDGFAVLTFATEQPRDGFVGLSQREFMEIFAELYQRLPPATTGSGNVSFSRRWAGAAEAPTEAKLRRVGITSNQPKMIRTATQAGAEVRHAFDHFTKISVDGREQYEEVLGAGGLLPISAADENRLDG